MISDSVPWRDELRKSAERLRRWNTQRRWTARTYFLAERDIMMGAYSIRRLIDSAKSSTRLPAKRMATRRYNLIGRTPMVLDHFDAERFYELDKPVKTELEVSKLCNQIIHSFFFQIYLEDDHTTSVVFNSDRDRDKHLHGITFRVLADLFDYVGREDIVEHSGTMISGQQKIVNVSNHDVVEDGRATYSDEEHVFIDLNYPLVPTLSEGAHKMVARQMAELRQAKAEEEGPANTRSTSGDG